MKVKGAHDAAVSALKDEHARIVEATRQEGENLREAERDATTQQVEALAAARSAELQKEWDAERARAVKLEMNKWQKALRDSEARLEAERAAAWRRGIEERDAMARAEATQLK